MRQRCYRNFLQTSTALRSLFNRNGKGDQSNGKVRGALVHLSRNHRKPRGRLSAYRGAPIAWYLRHVGRHQIMNRLDDQPAVLVIDDDPAVREGLSSLFRSVNLHVATFASAREFLQSKLPNRPCCLVLDVRLPGMSGLDFQSELTRANIRIPIVFMTGHGDIPMTVRAMKAGAVEFLTKPFRDQDMLDAVQLGLERDRERLERESSIIQLKSKFEMLTDREKKIMGYVTAGFMNKQIAGKIGLSEITVKVHRGHVMHKMGAKSLADLVRIAEVLGVTSGDA